MMEYENPGEWNKKLKELVEDCGVFYKYGSDNWFKFAEVEWNEELSEYLYNIIIARYNSHYQTVTKPKKNYTAKEHDERMLKHYYGLRNELAMRGMEDEAEELKSLMVPLFDDNDTPPPVIAHRFEAAIFREEVYTELIETFLLSARSAKIIAAGVAEINRHKENSDPFIYGSFCFIPSTK